MTTRRRAMSLIEVTIVVMLMGLLAAIAAPRFSLTLRAMQLDAATQQLVAHLRYVRQVAINEGRTTSISFDNLNDTYSCDVDSPAIPGEPLSVDVASDYSESLSLNANFDSSTTLSFDFEGVPHVGSDLMLDGEIVLSTNGNTFTIVIAPGTGRIDAMRLANGDEESQPSKVAVVAQVVVSQ
ncbi:MAG: GspH/FimT family pseudopilin [Rubripirellula sp.]